MAFVPRRSVLSAGLGLAGAALLGTPPASAARARSRYPRRSDYTRSVGRVFRVGNSHLRLRHVRDVPHTSARAREHCFVLVFEPVGTTRLPDGIYRVQRAGVPARSLFLSAVGTRRGMQAVISRPA